MSSFRDKMAANGTAAGHRGALLTALGGIGSRGLRGADHWESRNGCSLRAPAVLTPAIVDELNRSFRLVRSLPCDVTLGDHPAQYKMQEKFGKLKNTGSNPFIDPAGCLLEADIQESMLRFLTSSAKRLVLSSRINKRQLPTQPQDRGS